MDKIFLELHNNKYCKVPTNLVPEDNPGENYGLSHWLIRKISNNHFLCKEDMSPVHTGFTFKGVDKSDPLAIKLTGGSVALENMLNEHQGEGETFVTLSDLDDADIDMIPLYKEKLWMNVNNDGTIEKKYNDKGVISGTFTISALNLDPTVPKPDHNFKGYYLGNRKVDGTTVFQELEAGTMIMARWAELFDIVIMNGDVELSKTTIEINGTFTPTDKPIEGFRFDGYYTDSTFTEKCKFPMTVTKDTVIYAKYVQQVTVKVYDQDKTTVIQTQVMDINSEFTPNSPANKNGWNFAGFTNADGSVDIDIPVTVTANTDIYTKWERPAEQSITINGTEYSATYSSGTNSYTIELTGLEPLNKPGVVINGTFKAFEPVEGDLRLVVTPDQLFEQQPFTLIEVTPVKWTLIPACGSESYIIKEIPNKEFTLNYYASLGKFKEEINMPKVEGSDFEEKDANVSLDKRLFSDIACTQPVASPHISGNTVTADYVYGTTTTLPNAYIGLSTKDTMTVSIVAEKGQFVPTSFTVGTGQTLTLNEDILTVTVPEDETDPVHVKWTLDKFTYTHPSSGAALEVGWPGEIVNVNRSLELVPVFVSHKEFTVKWIDGVTQEVIKTEIVKEGQSANQPDTIPDHSAEHYRWTNQFSVDDWSSITADTEIVLQYEKEYKLTINYVDENGQPMSESIIAWYLAGERYSYTSPSIDGFTPDIMFVDSSSDGMPAEDIVITVTYESIPVPVPQDPEQPEV